MTLTNAYATLADVKVAAGIGTADTQDDSLLELSIQAASRSVDGYCERVFYTSGTQVRTYAATSAWYVDVDDIAGTAIAVKTSSGLDGVYDTAWTDADIQAEPLNRTEAGLVFPVSRLRAVQNYLFPVDPMGETGVQVTAVFGFGTAVPDQVTYATTLLALRHFLRFKSPMGIVGFGDMGGVRVSRVDPDVQALLAPFRKHPVGLA